MGIRRTAALALVTLAIVAAYLLGVSHSSAVAQASNKQYFVTVDRADNLQLLEDKYNKQAATSAMADFYIVSTTYLSDRNLVVSIWRRK